MFIGYYQLNRLTTIAAIDHYHCLGYILFSISNLVIDFCSLDLSFHIIVFTST
jgi:hypothetical protein